MPAKVRIYELSKELGIENQVCLKLCQTLNIGGDGGDLKISSSLPVAQAERVRRKAEREGLVRKAGASAASTTTTTSGTTQRRQPTSRRPRRQNTRQPGRGATVGRQPGHGATAGSTIVGRARPSKAVEQATVAAAADDSAQLDLSKSGVATARQRVEATERDSAEAGLPVVEPKDEATSSPVVPTPTLKDSQHVDGIAGSPTFTAPAPTLKDSQHGVPETLVEAKSAEVLEIDAPAHADTQLAAGVAVDPQTPTEAPQTMAATTEDVLAGGQPGTSTAQSGISQPATARASGRDGGQGPSRAAQGASQAAQGVSRAAQEATQVSQEATQADQEVSQIISSDSARQKASSRAAPLSATGRPIPPPPGRSKGITVDGEIFVPGGSRSRPRTSRPTKAPSGSETSTARRHRPRHAAPSVDAVFTPQTTRYPSSTNSGANAKGKSARGAGAQQFRPTAPRRRRGSRRRRRSVEDLRPLGQQQTSGSLVDAPVPEGVLEIQRNSTAMQIAPVFNRTAGDIVKYFMAQNEMIAANKPLSDDHIELYAAEIGVEVKIVDLEEEQEAELQELLKLPSFDPASEHLQPRPPIVTIMGHVDHGKTTLLDAIRETNVVSDEAGGITQHIGAYQVERNSQTITFIDTPGHEAFTAMRNRGANVTDVVVLVVAADDGLMPQTEEAIDHAQDAEVPIVVAINKMDKEDVNPDRVRQQLSEKGLVPEAWGGETVVEEISALGGLGLDSLLESILLQAEIQELAASEMQRAKGVVLESHKDIGRGPVATLLILEGTLQIGDPIVAGAVWGKVRALQDESGQQLKAAGPSMPVQVLGLSDVAVAGDDFAVAPSHKVAEKIGSARGKRLKAFDLGRDIGARTVGARLEDIFTSISAGETVTLNLVVKADMHGSMEALAASLKKLERDNLKLAFVRQGVGGITENDVQLALASNATIVGFNVRPDSNSRQLAAKEDVDIRLYEVIYKVTEDVEKALLGMLKPEIEERVTGEAEVREIFKIRRIGSVAGCFVRSGAVKKGSQVRFLRDGAIIWRGAIKSLRRFQDDANEVTSGMECGIGLSDFQDLKPGDIIETFEEHEIAPG